MVPPCGRAREGEDINSRNSIARAALSRRVKVPFGVSIVRNVARLYSAMLLSSVTGSQWWRNGGMTIGKKREIEMAKAFFLSFLLAQAPLRVKPLSSEWQALLPKTP